MTMLCYKNGSLAREAVRDASAHGSWSAFNDLLRGEPAGNKGRIGFYHYLPEITPTLAVPRVVRFNAAGAEVAAFDTPGVRASVCIRPCTFVPLIFILGRCPFYFPVCVRRVCVCVSGGRACHCGGPVPVHACAHGGVSGPPHTHALVERPMLLAWRHVSGCCVVVADAESACAPCLVLWVLPESVLVCV